VRRLSELFEAQAYKSIVHGIAYEPGRLPGIINLDGQLVLNTHVPPHIAPWKDDSGIWEQFLAHLFPDDEDRFQFCRWLATLVASPGVRMMYGVLLVSVTQGVGKSTLFDIVCSLVGLQNCSTPSASLIVNSDFNGWLARKRLVAVHEIYEGGSWKAYNRLKSAITDELLLVNEKFTATYTVRNQAHFLLGPNSERALMIEQSDRR
jgi:phage/plasmid-associated DNA primase